MVRKALLALLVTAIVSVPPASARPDPQPLSPDQAQALATQAGGEVAGSIHRITPQQALAAASVAGAVTETAPGLTVRQAVGLDPVRRLARRLESTFCWNTSDSWWWGGWPYDRHLADYTSWCGSGGTLTYRSSHATQSQNICNPNGTYGFKIAGGVGSSYVAFREGGYWSCPTDVPWFTMYFDDWMDIYVNGSGGYWIYEASSP